MSDRKGVRIRKASRLEEQIVSALFDGSRFVGFPKNRYEALDQVQSFLEFNGVDLGTAFEVLLNSNDGYLTYWFGDVEIQFTRGFGVWSGSSNTVQMSIELDNEKAKESVVYEYVLKDLKLVKRNRRLTTKGLRGDHPR